jgi:amino acid adenylation domain-containing protein
MKESLILYNDLALPEDARYDAETAIIESCSGRSICFAQLRKCIRNLAICLRLNHGLNESERVVVMSHKTIEDVVLFYAALSAGLVYIPADPKLGGEKLQYLLNQVEPTLILDTAHISGRMHVEYRDGEIYLNGQLTGSFEDVDVTYQKKDSESTAYIIYTSGSGGLPKGVQITRKAPALFAEYIKTYGFYNDKTIFLSICPFYFDATILELFGILPLHGQLILTGDIVFPADMLEPMEKYKITDGLWVPSMFKILLSRFSDIDRCDLSSIKRIWFGGEHCTWQLWRALADKIPGVQYVHGYGPTETVHSCMILPFDESYDFSEFDELPLGDAFYGSRVFVLNENREKVGLGEIGELYVESPTIMTGYYKDPERSAKVMVNIPAISPHTLYKTGDMVLHSKKGNYYFRGRTDDLVKVSGVLISLNEIEKVVMHSGLVKEAVLAEVTLSDAGSNALVAFIRPENHFQQTELIRFLRENLEPAKVPRYFELSDEVFQMTRNGKVDKKLLAEQFIHKHSLV